MRTTKITYTLRSVPGTQQAHSGSGGPRGHASPQTVFRVSFQNLNQYNEPIYKNIIIEKQTSLVLNKNHNHLAQERTVGPYYPALEREAVGLVTPAAPAPARSPIVL